MLVESGSLSPFDGMNVLKFSQEFILSLFSSYMRLLPCFNGIFIIKLAQISPKIVAFRKEEVFLWTHIY